MAVNEKEMTLDLEMMKRAAENFKKASASRERKTELLKQKRYTEVESKERLTTRANRLLSQVKEFYTVEAIPPKMRDLVKKEHITESEISDMLFERIIGATKDFLSAAFLERGVRVTRSVGRVVIRVDGNIAGYGTGFLVTPHLMMTNWHVFNSREMAEESLIEFNYQYGISGTPLQVETFRLDPAAFFMNNKDLDFAIVAVKQTSELGTPVKKMGFCPLIAAHGKISVGEFVNIIQHPRGEMKQVIVRENKLLDIPDSPGTVAHYEGDTEQGSSGSPVFNDDWEVVALHHTGVPKTDSQGNLLDKDGNIWQEGDDPARLEWIANEGIRISSICEFITRKDVKEHEKELKDELVEMSKYELSPWQIPEVINATETLIPEKKEKTMRQSSIQQMFKPAAASAEMPSGTVEMKIPFTINISISPQGIKAEGIEAPLGVQVFSSENFIPAAIKPEEVIKPDTNYSDRPGFNPEFLGIHLPLPKLSNSIMPLAVEVEGAEEDNKYELKYYHYSVIMNAKRKLAFVSAVNFNGAARYKYTRDKGGDKWFIDPRVRDFQAGAELYSDNPLDRGHLTRRADAAWGSTEREAKLANDDTFHFTNCTPQHEVFNQATKADKRGIKLWGNIEEYIAKQAKDGKMKLSIFNGPVFRQNDRCYRGIMLPREFWKIVAYIKDNGEPSAAAFKLSQETLIKNLAMEEFEPGPYRAYQVSIKDIESITKLDFGNLSNYDPLNKQEKLETFFEEGSEAIPLWRLNHIIL